jgi:hypothetical protein
MPNFTYTEKGHKYELDGVKMTGVTTVLGVLAKPALIPWAAKMTAEWIRENCESRTLSVVDNATESGEVRYDVGESDLNEAVKAHTKKKDEGAVGGKDLHSMVENYIKGCIELGGDAVPSPEDHNGLQEFVKWATLNKIKFLTSETPTYSQEWFVAGTPDFTLEKDGKKFVGDLKSYKKIFDRIPHFQCAAYAKMLTEQGEKFDGTVIVNINKESFQLTEAWSFDLENDVKAFEAALVLYRQLNNF